MRARSAPHNVEGHSARSQPFSAVVRLSDVAISRAALEDALRAKLDRYEPAREGSLHYAQVDIPFERDAWNAIVDCVETIGPGLSVLRQEHAMGPVVIDVAVSLDEQLAMLSVGIPSHAAVAIGRHGFDIEVSVYLTSDDEEL